MVSSTAAPPLLPPLGIVNLQVSTLANLLKKAYKLSISAFGLLLKVSPQERGVLFIPSRTHIS